MTNEHIYALTYWFDGKKIYFYVGRSARDDGIRFKEHQYAAEWGHTSVYKYIRENVICEIFEEEILCRCSDEIDVDDSEFYWVVKLIREGHKLMNEKNGDAKRIAAEECAASTYAINTVADVRTYKKMKIKEACDKAEKLRQSIMGTATEERYDPSAAYIKSMASKVAEKREEVKQRMTKSARAKAAREEAHQKWLYEQRALFEENGRTINGEHV